MNDNSISKYIVNYNGKLHHIQWETRIFNCKQKKNSQHFRSLVDKILQVRVDIVIIIIVIVII